MTVVHDLPEPQTCRLCGETYSQLPHMCVFNRLARPGTKITVELDVREAQVLYACALEGFRKTQADRETGEALLNGGHWDIARGTADGTEAVQRAIKKLHGGDTPNVPCHFGRPPRRLRSR
jgi:hypothetical protein